MAFYGERFRRPDEEDIWEELKKMLTNPPSEAEKLQKKKEEQAWIDSILSKAFPDEPTAQKEPYLRYEELLPPAEAEVYRKKQLAGAEQKTSLKNPYSEIDAHSEWGDEIKAQKKSEVAKIQETAKQREKEINREHLIEQSKNYGGAALEIGSAFVPGTLGPKVATKAIKTSKPLIEQIVKKNIARGGAEGLTAGSMSGFGQGLLEDENLLKSTAIGGLTGGATGATLGKISGEIVGKTPKIKELDELLDKRNDWGIAFTKQSGKPSEAIDKLLEQKQGFVPKAAKKEGIGDIDFVYGKGGKRGYGVSHIIDQRNNDGLNGVQFTKQLPNIISEGKVEKNSNQPNIDFIRLGEDSALVKKVWDDKKRNWIVTAFKDRNSLNKFINRTPDIVNNQNGMTPPLNLNKDINIIPPSQSNLNPSQQSIQKPLSHNDWLEELKRKRKKFGWW